VPATLLEPVIGLEIHLHLKTRTKMFCGCAADYFGQEPNSSVCPICLGLPGSLPQINRRAVEFGVMFGLALNARIPEWFQFHRKHYFYPDNPKNYQITQYDTSVAVGGWLETGAGKRVHLGRINLEEDAGKNIHPEGLAYSLVDFNRAGVPLVEMATAPEITSGLEARKFLQQIQAIARALGVSSANPEEGSMRADVNVSVREPGGPLGTKVEVKNVNSFRSVQRAIEHEIERQSRILARGGRPLQETRHWDEQAGATYDSRVKEEAQDYRYFPEPDLPPLVIEPEWVEEIRGRMPELPAARRERLAALGVREADAELISLDVATGAVFDAAVTAHPKNPQGIANWLVGDVAGRLAERGLTIDQTGLRPEHLAALVRLIDAGEITGKTGKDLLPEVLGGHDPGRLVEERGLRMVSEAGALEGIVRQVVEANPEIVARIKEGKTQALNALLGQVLRQTRGQAKPDVVRQLLEEAIR
jgi:aspartyl-tRNA(Asn)/glutamyl-tRNA(Gln) amidotransferase subunit B